MACSARPRFSPGSVFVLIAVAFYLPIFTLARAIGR
jgi:hypothetical protein